MVKEVELTIIDGYYVIHVETVLQSEYPGDQTEAQQAPAACKR